MVDEGEGDAATFDGKKWVKVEGEIPETGKSKTKREQEDVRKEGLISKSLS